MVIIVELEVQVFFHHGVILVNCQVSCHLKFDSIFQYSIYKITIYYGRTRRMTLNSVMAFGLPLYILQCCLSLLAMRNTILFNS